MRLILLTTLFFSACRLFGAPEDPDPDVSPSDTGDMREDAPSDVREDQDADEDTRPDQGPRDWWDPSFSHRVRISVDSEATNETIRISLPVDFPLADIEPKSLRPIQNGVVIPLDVERADAESVSFWIRIPDLSVPLDLYWGNPNAFSAEDTSQTWADHTAVFHFADASEAKGVIGATQNELNATYQKGEVGYELSLSQGFVGYPNLEQFDITAEEPQLLIETYIKLESDENQFVLWKEGNCVGWSVSPRNQQWRGTIGMSPDGCPNADYTNSTNGSVVAGVWTYVAFFYDVPNDRIVSYQDGVKIGEDPMGYTPGFLTTRNARFSVGTDWQQITGIDAVVDEVRFSRRTPDDAYIDLQMKSFQNSLTSFGPIETY